MARTTYLYKLTAHTAHEGYQISWHWTEPDARAAAAEWRDHSDPDDVFEVTVEAIQLTLSKAGVMRLLRLHTPSSDNG